MNNEQFSSKKQKQITDSLETWRMNQWQILVVPNISIGWWNKTEANAVFWISKM